MFGRSPTHRQPADFTHADGELLEALALLEGTANYREWIIEHCAPFLGGDILEVGAGQGTYTNRLADFGTVTALEPSQAQYDLLQSKVRKNPQVTTKLGDLETLGTVSGAFDCAVLVNVLEHIPNDGEALDVLHHVLRHDGVLLLWVPAFELLYGRFDHEIGHFRRYRKRALCDLLAEHGYSVIHSWYASLPGWFGWLLVVRLLGQRPTVGKLSSLYDRSIVPLLRRVERRVHPPFGQSVFVAARRA